MSHLKDKRVILNNYPQKRQYDKNPQHAFVLRGSKVGEAPRSNISRHVKNPFKV
jgi:hypothetical protein